ncbi:alpha-1,4-glucan--maltose-1-phosphate maltosyltransferase [Neorhizobium alkalisoli]|uniref:Alpha-1,4-glucan:maltose-1-phosphate maltosyltransferase n=1 Tax=Neorhizobium alkalisoli TaxID=528178 RepID=A0A561R884_9HYPH|nr:alpha-1,4-glucan--maltose-1-phosphate maltosyltransferase [Neorhizobium alkalisoli]TWF58824.1 alpha-1,4-glucan:maltose-1-phosphate maltosyltransferase [Neorhizobium alkalisoli]
MNTRPQFASRTLLTDLPPQLYYVHPLALKGMEAWKEVFAHARNLGFDTVLSGPLYQRGDGSSIFTALDFERLDPELGLGDNPVEAIAMLVAAAKGFELKFMLDLVVDRVAVDREEAKQSAADPRLSPQQMGAKSVNFLADVQHIASWRERLVSLAKLGVAGFRCMGIGRVAPEVWSDLITHTRSFKPETIFIAWTPGSAFADRQVLKGCGMDGSFSSLAWWDMEERWIMDEYQIQRELGYQVAFPEAPFGRRIAHGTDGCEVLKRKALRALKLASTFTSGLMMPMGFEYGVSLPLDPLHGDGAGLRGLKEQSSYDLSAEIREINGTPNKTAAGFARRPLKLVSASQGPVVGLFQTDQEDSRASEKMRVVLLNRDLRKVAAAPFNVMREAASPFLPLLAPEDETEMFDARLKLKPGEIRIFEGYVSEPIVDAVAVPAAGDAAATPRLAIEKITPAVDDGRFVVKRVVGEALKVEADIFGDGHDPLSAALLFRAADDADWQEVPMQLVANDRWKAEFPLKRLGRYEFAVEGWKNPFQIFRYEFTKKHEAGLDLRLEIQEGINLVLDALDHARGELKPQLQKLFDRLTAEQDKQRTQTLLMPETAELMAKADRRPHRVRSQVIPVDAERTAAAFASWYQIFPRSQSGDPNRHGTFDDVIARLPAIREMGFDVLYFPPIHPIGSTNRKGKNNTLTPGPDDPGSPYAIGSPDGGHADIHPELGTFSDFRRLVDAAADHGLEIALDLAIQASPDHPWLKSHPGWFDWRPDGTIRYAENPPKKYEDIVNVDFYAKEAVPSLWVELRDVVQKWVDHGVKLFRVDNPHTKPFPFWEWLIADIRARHPDVVFLSEAFTKPKVMYRLAKVGFSQSYTYFTWRNAKWELEQYMREITTEEPKDFFRPHFFVNTHDINPDFLQYAPRPAYLIRAALAATLSGLWGVYNGFELCEGRPDAKRKEYADSEKYEIRAWDYDRPGNIKGEIALLNRIRRENPALHSHLGLQLLTAWNDNIMFFEKASAGRENVLLIAINLDPHAAHEADVEIPLWSWNLPDHGSLQLEDLVGGNRFTWTGKIQRLRLDPQAGLPLAIWRVR